MPIEVQRKIGRLGLGGNWPVIMQIVFKDDNDRGQEHLWTFENTALSDRKVHYAWVGYDAESSSEDWNPDAPNAQDGPPGDIWYLGFIVERIDKFPALDNPDRGQEYEYSLDNTSYSNGGPPFFTTHAKTHCLKLYNNWQVARPDYDTTKYTEGQHNDAVNHYWTLVELIDELSVVDQRGQETVWTLTGNPQTEKEFNEMVSSDGLTLNEGVVELYGDPPDPALYESLKGARLDPFQNPVRIGPPLPFHPILGFSMSSNSEQAPGFRQLSYFPDWWVESGGIGWNDQQVGVNEKPPAEYMRFGTFGRGSVELFVVCQLPESPTISITGCPPQGSSHVGTMTSEFMVPGSDNGFVSTTLGNGSVTVKFHHANLDEGSFTYFHDSIGTDGVFGPSYYGALAGGDIDDVEKTMSPSAFDNTTYPKGGISYDAVLDTYFEDINHGTGTVVLYSSQFGPPDDYDPPGPEFRP